MSSLKKSQRSLRSWTKQKWRTKSGKKSSETGERYLPEKAIKALSSKEYAESTRKKREDTRKGKQHSKQSKKTARKVRKYRRVNFEGGVVDTELTYEEELAQGKYDEQLRKLFNKELDKDKEEPFLTTAIQKYESGDKQAKLVLDRTLLILQKEQEKDIRNLNANEQNLLQQLTIYLKN